MKENPWNSVLGPFYNESSILDRGLTDTEELIALKARGGEKVYPHAQFTELADRTLQRREEVLALWNNLIAPAIEEGVVDEWTATALLLQSTPEHISRAEIITQDPSQVERVAQQISHALVRFRNDVF